MYLRHTKIRKNGKTLTYWRLVRSVRTGSKVRQETVAYLGELDAEGRAKASALAKHFLGPRAVQRELFEDTRRFEPQSVQLEDVRAENGRAFGDVWLGLQLWRALQLDEFCERVLPRGKETVPWADVAAILTIARLCEPSSELHIAEDWYRRTALRDLLGIAPEKIHHTRLYQGLDQLLLHKRDLQQHLKSRLGELFAIDYELLLYDVTSVYFEGEAAGNKMAKRGHSRDHRPDCKQVCLGLVVTREGFPLGYELFEGNRVDVTTVKQMVKEMEDRYGKANRVWVMDRGMASEANLEWLREEGRRYLIGTPRTELRRWEREILEQDGWSKIRDELEVKLCQGPGGAETFVLCRSAQRQKKEKAMHDRFATRIAESLASLARRLENAGQPEDRGKVERQIGRLLGKNSRAAGKFKIQVVEDSDRASGLRLDWSEDTKWAAWAEIAEGTYILRSNVTDWTADELWRTYIQLSEAEAAFRIHKSDLQIRPVWHQIAERVEAHILVCFLAYVLWKTLQGWQSRAGLGSSPRTVLEEMHRLQSVDVVLPLTAGGELLLRCVVRPDKDQADILARLGLNLPRRLKPPAPEPTAKKPKCSAQPAS